MPDSRSRAVFDAVRVIPSRFALALATSRTARLLAARDKTMVDGISKALTIIANQERNQEGNQLMKEITEMPRK